jgi:hypothetical protein
MRLTLLPGGVQTFDIKRIGTRVSLGRKEGSDIIINEPVVSGTHCYITVVSRSEASIEDSSTNGTYINGVKIGKGSRLGIRDGDMLTLGKPGTASGPIGSGVCVNFRVSFDGQESESAPQAVTSSMVFKQDIEDLKVMVSQGEHRNEVLSSKNAELSTKMLMSEGELKRIREENIELSVRNDSMKNEIESLRQRLGQADHRADLAEKRTETLQFKLSSMEKEYADIALIKAEYNLTTSLREELDRLRRRNTELSSQLNNSFDVRRKLTANLESIQQLAISSLRVTEELNPMADLSSTGTISSPKVIQNIKRPNRAGIRGDILGYSYPDAPVESVPMSEMPVEIAAPMMIEDGPDPDTPRAAAPDAPTPVEETPAPVESTPADATNESGLFGGLFSQ